MQEGAFWSREYLFKTVEYADVENQVLYLGGGQRLGGKHGSIRAATEVIFARGA